MTQDNRGGAPSRGGPGGNRNDGPGGRRNDGPGGNRGGPRKGGFGKGGPSKAPRAETYESLKEIVRGPDFRIDKFQVAEKGTHKSVKVEYRLTREGMKSPQAFDHLSDAQAAAIAPLPEPEPEGAVEAVVETDAETAEEMDAQTNEGGSAVPAAEPTDSGETAQ